ncbi:MAG: glycosyltransferase family 9 protein [Paracoccaceae bacterium]|nr:glycosyltransferase family 9 protein [Paracoccaceae bacterium]
MNEKVFDRGGDQQSGASASRKHAFHLGRSAASAGAHAAAVTHFQVQIAQTPDHYETWLQMGKALKRLRRFSEAEEAFTTVLYQTKSADPALELSRIAFHNLDYDRAEEMAQLALKRAPKQNQVHAQIEVIDSARAVRHFRLGIRAVRNGDNAAATTHFQAQIAQFPNHFETWLHMGKAFKRLKRIPEAKMAFSAIVRRLQSAEPALELSRIALHESNYDRAEEIALAALEREPNQSQIQAQLESIAAARAAAHFRLGASLVRNGDSAAAITHFKTQIAQTPDHFETWLQMGKAFKRLKRFSEAKEAFTKILPRGQSAEPALELSRIALHDLDYDRAEEMAQLALERGPSQSQAQAQLVQILMRKNRFSEALNYAKMLVQSSQDSVLGHTCLAICAYGVGADLDGNEHLDQACSAAEKTKDGFQSIARILRDSNSPAAVIRFIDIALDAHPDLIGASFWDVKARHMKKEGKPEAAILAYVQAILRHPSKRGFYVEVARLLSSIAQEKARNDVITTPEREVALDFLGAAYSANRKDTQVLSALFDHHLKAKAYEKAWRYLSELEQLQKDLQLTEIYKTRFFLAQGRWQEALQVAERLEQDVKPSPRSWKSVAKAWETFGATSLQEAALHKAITLSEAPPDLLIQHTRALYELGSFHQAGQSHRQTAIRSKEKSQNIKDLKPLGALLKDAIPDHVPTSSNSASATFPILIDGWTRWQVRYHDEDWFLFARGRRSANNAAAIAAPMLAEVRPAVGYVYAEAADQPKQAADAFTRRVPEAQTCSVFACRQADLEQIAKPLATESIPMLLRRIIVRLNGQYAPNVTLPCSQTISADPDLGALHAETTKSVKMFSAEQIDALLEKGAGQMRATILETGARAAIFTPETAWAVDAIADCRINRILVLEQVPAPGELPKTALARFDRIAPRTREVQAWLEDVCRISSSLVEDAEAAAAEDDLHAHGETLIVVGAGIGNVLQATPLIRHISEKTGQQVDVLLRSGVPVVAELFTNSPYVRHAFTTTDRVRDIAYRRSLVTQSAGGVIPFLNTAQILVLRRSFDMFDRCRFMHEAEFNFLGADRLFPELGAQDDTPGPFIRQLSMESWQPPEPKTAAAKPVIGLVSSVPTDPLFAKRSWPHYPELVAQMRAQGWEVRSFGLPPEFIEGSVNRTGIPFRDMISEITECDVFVTTDTGAFHVAEATGVPTVVLWGPSSTIKNGPLSPRTLQLFSERACAPCQFKLDFLLCDDPVCMQDITVDQVVAAVRAQIETPGAMFDELSQSYRRHEADHLATPFRADFTARYSRLSDEILSTMTDLFERFFNGYIATGRFDRASDVLERFLPVQHCTGAHRLLYARLAFESKAYGDALTHLEEADDGLADTDAALWIELKAKSLRRLHRFTDLAQMWSDLTTDARDSLAKRPNAAVTALKQIAFGLARCNLFAEAEKALLLAVDIAPSAKDDITPILEQLRDDIGRHFGARSSILHPDRIKWAVVTEDAQDLSRTPLQRQQVELFWYRPDEIEVLDRDRHMFDVISDATKANATTHDIPAKDLRFTDWRDAANAFSHTKILSARKRIVVFCHHHPFRWNPRGGERSTRTIAKALQEDGFDILFVVENKKTNETFCEIYEGCAIMVCGELRFKDACLGAIACWRPDLAIMYGETSVRASEACREAELDYIMYPRDWGEITRAAPQNLLSLSPTDPNAITPAYRALYAGAWRTITNCDYAGDIIQHFYKTRSETAYVPVEHPQNPDQYDPEGPVLLINPAKGGGQELLQTLAMRMPETAFRVIGGKAGQFPSNVEIRPFHDGPYEDMYQGVSLTLFPFGGMEACGTGRVVLESYHCGVPVLASASGGIPEAVPDQWLISEDTDIQEWVEGIRRVLKSGVQDLDPRTLLEPFLPESALRVSRRAVSQYFSDHEQQDPSLRAQSG